MFHRIPRQGNEELYELEEAAIAALEAVAKHRVKAYGEKLFDEAWPEVIHAVLDSIVGSTVLPAVEHWTKNSPAWEASRAPRFVRMWTTTNPGGSPLSDRELRGMYASTDRPEHADLARSESLELVELVAEVVDQGESDP